MYAIDENFIQGRNIMVNEKMVNFNDSKRKETVANFSGNRLNFKKDFFKKIEKNPEEIRKYFSAKLRKRSYLIQKKMRFIMRKIVHCLKKFLK